MMQRRGTFEEWQCLTLPLLQSQVIQVRMGGCIADSPVDKRHNRPNYNPIQVIIGNNSIESLREKWNLRQLKTMEQKMLGLPNNTIRFQEFCQLFPKITEFSKLTQTKIYELFAYEGNRNLSKQEMVNSLTLIRKVTLNADFAPFLFYIYTQDSKHQTMDQKELMLFKQQNQQFLKRIPLNGTYEVDSNELEPEDETIQISNGSKPIKRKPPLEKEAVNDQQTNAQSKSRQIKFPYFRQQFQKYNLIAYQVIFSWDQMEQQRELVQKLQKEKVSIEKGEKVYLTDYKWWLEWTTYVQQYYGVKLDFIRNETHNYTLAKNRYRKQSITRQSGIDPSAIRHEKATLKPPGQIKNGCLLKQGRNRSQLIPNLVELDNYICLPEKVWNKLVAIYHGGPPIQREYPRIYHNLIIKTTLTQEGRFSYRSKKYSKTDNFKLADIATPRQLSMNPYYKYGGRTNWMKLPPSPKSQDEIFNSIKTYLVFVPTHLENLFLNNYNIQESKQGKTLKRRFKNYGAEINISVDGILTKAEVIEIVRSDAVKVSYVDYNGNACQKTVVIDDKLQELNPEKLDLERKLNQLPGLLNLGNTCYMNAVLQCLIRTPYFGGYLQKQDFKARQEPGEQYLLEELSILQKEARSKHTLDIVTTKHFKQTLDKYCPFFQGNLQHDAQEFLICLLVRLSEEIKSKTEYGSVTQSKGPKDFNKKIVKFFSGKTEAVTECLKCHNKGTRVQPFFTYSISLPELKDMEYHYYFIENPSKAKSTIPMRYGITLDRKVTAQQFIEAVGRVHRKPVEKIALYTVFNNQILSRLEPHSWQQQIAHHLNFNVKLVCYQIQHQSEPTYHSYRTKQLANRSVKLQLRQRMYSTNTNDYFTKYMPFLLQITEEMKWNQLIEQIEMIISKLKDTEVSPSRVSNSGIKVELDETGHKKTNLQDGGSQNKPYVIRIIKNDHLYENSCFFCKNQFILSPRSKSNYRCTREKCHFKRDIPLFQDLQFRNFNDNIIITVDWEQDVFSDIPPNNDHPSYEEALKKTQSRKDMLEQVMVDSFKLKETLELTCQKKQCLYQLAERVEKIAVPPNILLLHLKRFRYEDNRLIKLTNRVVYPPKLTLPGTNETYQLYGVVVHYGSGVGGHYISYVCVNRKWYCCDDSKVTLAEPGDQIDTNAYLLFYHKVDFEPSLICLSF